jgi:cyclopropane-fatty-acyl-phospholipid synthase
VTAAAERSGPRAPGAAPAAGGPLIPAAPAGRARAAAARLLVSRMAARLPIRIEFPDGSAAGAGGPGAPCLVVANPAAFYARIGAGTVGFAESYIAGDWDCADLAGLFEVLAGHLAGLVPRPLGSLRRWYVPHQPAGDEATRDGARRNIQRHYDLSDDLFALFLDPGMTYSSALFEPGDSLEQAQHRKIDRLLDQAGVGPGSRVLEIGTGWGELALRAAARGARVTSLTISAAQWAAATRRAAAAGLAGRVDVQIRDYRDAAGRYDAVLSVEMVEAVGARYWPEYFRVIDRVLVPGGLAGLQAITMPHDRMLATTGRHSWIHQYIFPGGQIPSLEAITGTLREHTGLAVRSDLAMGQHYATTLRQWRERFVAAADEVDRLGFSPAFRRMWELYLAYSEGGFRAGYLNVHQLILGR